jgi:hypothetical protein
MPSQPRRVGVAPDARDLGGESLHFGGAGTPHWRGRRYAAPSGSRNRTGRVVADQALDIRVPEKFLANGSARDEAADGGELNSCRNAAPLAKNQWRIVIRAGRNGSVCAHFKGNGHPLVVSGGNASLLYRHSWCASAARGSTNAMPPGLCQPACVRVEGKDGCCGDENRIRGTVA